MISRLVAAVETARLLRSETGPVTFGDLFDDDYDHEDLARLVVAAQEFNTLWGLVRKVVDGAWVESYHSHGPVEVDGVHVYVKKTRTDEKCIDPEGFLAWLSANPDQLGRVLNPNQVKKGSLPPAVRSTFFEQRAVEKPETAEVVESEVLDLARARKTVGA